MPTLATQEKCYGCAACSNICPKHCIAMATNEYGEQRPVIDYQKCVNCGKCTSVCPVLKQPVLETPLKVYAMTIRDYNHKKGSASGGAARLLYEQALKEGKVVFGCDFDEEYILRMRSASAFEEIEGFRNSKYTYCRMGQTYREIQELLKNDKSVLFIGSSCQVDALKRFLGEEYDKLTTVDLICHGVPPEKYFRDYLELQNKLLKQKAQKISFRGNDKNRDYYLRLFSEKECIYDVYAREDLYFAGYVNYVMFEEKCYSCPFAGENRVADLSIGDWWGDTEIQGHKLSLIFANTEKGLRQIGKILEQEGILWEEHTLQEAIGSNEQLRGPSQMPQWYHEMRECYRQNGFKSMAEKYIQPLIQSYQKKQRMNKVHQVFLFPMRVLRKIKRMVIK